MLYNNLPANNFNINFLNSMEQKRTTTRPLLDFSFLFKQQQQQQQHHVFLSLRRDGMVR
jgi:hypothetical protein